VCPFAPDSCLDPSGRVRKGLVSVK
jgi:hypothetical protein